MTWTLFYITAALAVAVCGGVTVAPGVKCDDIDTNSCITLKQARPDVCSDPAIYTSVCPRFCGKCPLSCFHCDDPVNTTDECTTTKMCAMDETCMIKSVRATSDGHQEFMMTCENKAVCDGSSFGFNVIGKRGLSARDISVHCCNTDNCNKPVVPTTTLRPTSLTFGTIPPSPLSCVRDVAFVIDASGSVGSFNFDKMLGYVGAVIQHLVIGPSAVQTALMTFSSTPHKEWYFNEVTDMGDTLSRLKRVSYRSGSTKTDLAITFLRRELLSGTNGDRQAVPDDVIIITDGKSNSPQLTLQAANGLHTDSNDVIAIGVGAGVSAQELDHIATDHGHVINVRNFGSLMATLPKVLQLICQ